MPANRTRYAIDALLKRTVSLANPFDRRTREGRVFAGLLQGLAEDQGAETFRALPVMRRVLTWRFCMIHLRLALDDAHAIAANPQAPMPKQHDRHIAYVNALTRLAATLGVSTKARSVDIALLLASLPQDGLQEGKSSARALVRHERIQAPALAEGHDSALPAGIARGASDEAVRAE